MLDRWNEARKKEAQERADLAWASQTKPQVITILLEVRTDLADLVVLAYRVLSPALQDVVAEEALNGLANRWSGLSAADWVWGCLMIRVMLCPAQVLQ